VGQFGLQNMRQTGSDFTANQHLYDSMLSCPSRDLSIAVRNKSSMLILIGPVYADHGGGAIPPVASPKALE
jgi:hypothetical protein